MLILIGAGLLVTFSRQAWIGAIVGYRSRLRRRPVWSSRSSWKQSSYCNRADSGAHEDFRQTISDRLRILLPPRPLGRINLWTQAIHLVPHHAALGVGPGLFETLNPEPGKGVYYAHNVFLDAAVELGIAGALALLAVFVLALKSAWSRRATFAFSLLVGYAVANLFDDTLYTPRNGLLLAVGFALIAAGNQGRDRRTKKYPEPSMAEAKPVNSGSTSLPLALQR